MLTSIHIWWWCNHIWQQVGLCLPMHHYYWGAVCDTVFAAYVVNMQGQVVTTVSYIDPTVVLFSHHHIPVVALSVAIFVFVLLPPTILLMLYPFRCFQKASTHLNTRWQLRLKYSETHSTEATRTALTNQGTILTSSRRHLPHLDNIPGSEWNSNPLGKENRSMAANIHSSTDSFSSGLCGAWAIQEKVC